MPKKGYRKKKRNGGYFKRAERRDSVSGATVAPFQDYVQQLNNVGLKPNPRLQPHPALLTLRQKAQRTTNPAVVGRDDFTPHSIW